MNAHSKIHQAHLDEWTARIADQSSSGLTVRDWCNQNDISIHKYNYWKHQLKEQYADTVLPDIVPVFPPKTVSPVSCELHELSKSYNSSSLCNTIPTNNLISITIRDIRIEITSTDVMLLADIIKAVRNA